ncbi:MAG: signal peptidase I [Alcaligenaceae bacterium]|nr:MAG: signal peptidase I [Alcaligenaceae bacterium]
MSWNFALVLFVLLVLTGIIWVYDFFVGRRVRTQRMQAAAAEFDANQSMIGRDSADVAREREQVVGRAGRMSWWTEYATSFFPVILFVFVLRSFVVEPFRIPSGSMLPTLQSGDLILVNKFSYGIRLPVLDKKVIDIGTPKRGDVMVFRYPVEPDVDYIKRVVGLPGDEIAYVDKKLYVNGAEVPHTRDGDYYEPDRVSYIAQFEEKLGETPHKILLDPRRAQEYSPIWAFPYQENCQYARNGLRCTVPQGHYFAMGDNRDNSADSRYWGFVPDQNIVGKAFLIWMNFSDLGRIGRFN